jgi:hypothetical protein
MYSLTGSLTGRRPGDPSVVEQAGETSFSSGGECEVPPCWHVCMYVKLCSACAALLRETISPFLSLLLEPLPPIIYIYIYICIYMYICMYIYSYA